FPYRFYQTLSCQESNSMFGNLFSSRRLFQLFPEDNPTAVRLATFGYVHPKPPSDDRTPTRPEAKLNLVLYCTDHRLLLYQFGCFPADDQENEEQFQRRHQHCSLNFESCSHW